MAEEIETMSSSLSEDTPSQSQVLFSSLVHILFFFFIYIYNFRGFLSHDLLVISGFDFFFTESLYSINF